MSTDEAQVASSRSRLSRLAQIAAWLAAIALLLFVLDQLGVPVASWIHKLFKDLRAVPAGAIVGGVVLDTVQTVFAAVSWLTILRVALPDAGVPFRPVLAAYAVAVALNGFLPANIGTLVMMLMFASLFAGATFAIVLSGFFVQKIPFTVLSIASYVYLFATASGSLSIESTFISDHPGTIVLLTVVGVVLIALVGRVLWRRSTKLREQVKTGGAVLAQPRRFLVGVALPQVASYAARLGIVAVFLAAYSIPVSFHTVVAVTGANSVSNSVSVTPGGVGVTQALNVAVLDKVTTKANATAYSVGQQLIIAAWDIIFAIVMVVWVFGWSGGKELVRQSYEGAQVKERELKAQREARREARRAEGRRRFRVRRDR